MTEQKISEKMSSFSRPMISTMFHIDFEWLIENDQNWHISLSGYLCEKHRMFFDTTKGHQMIDSINPKTGEVIQTDQLMDILMNHCAKQDNFIPPNGTLTDSVFRLFLSNGNQPLNAEEIGKIINRSPETILKTLSGPRIYKGIKPL